MLRRVLFLSSFFFLLWSKVSAQTYNMSAGTINACSGTFYDSNGGAGDYFNNENITQTICSGVAGQCVRLVFTSFDLETNYDYLRIYDGPNTSSPLIGTYTGNVGPGLITSNSGCITLRFTSDGVGRYTGWAAQISCVPCASGVCATTCNGGPPPANDACTGAINLGTLPVPSACPGGVGGLTTLNTTNLCATAPSPYTSLLGCQPAGNMASPAADVWYRFDVTGPSLNINISGGLTTPNVGLYQGTTCANLIPRGCAIGSGGSLNTTFGALTSGTYYLQVSGGNINDQCDFSLTLQNNFDCAGCVIQSNITANPPPVNGTYNAGQLVNFCFTITDYNQTSANWLHGVIPSFGAGWDMSTFTPLSSTNCSGDGTWNWYNTNITSSATGNVTGPGFYYESDFGNINGVTDGNPGNNFGDNNAANSCDWTFCWSVRTLPIGSCIQGASLNVNVNTTGDGESGSWGSLACTQDAVTNFFAALTCCQAPVINFTNPTCPNSSNGTATALGQGTGPFDYVWMNSVGLVLLSQNNIAGSSTVSGLAAGTYTVQVTDNNGCTSNAAVTITAPAAFTASMTTTPSTCNGSNNGTASVVVSGGTGGYTYAWSPAGSGSNPSGLPAGNYTVTVTDNRGCTATTTGTVTQPVALVLSTTGSTNATCSNSNDGSISVIANGGTPGYTYAWNTGATGATLNNITGGAYTVTVTDSKGCTAFMTVAISAPSALVLNMSSTASSCGNANGTASVSVLGGTPLYTYQWSPSGGTNSSASGLVAGGYNVTVTDSRGCTAIGNVVVSNSSGPTATISASSDVTCNGGNNGSATVSVAGGTAPITYAWSPSGGNGTTASGLSAGNYTIVVTDGSGCTSAASVVIAEPLALTVVVSAVTDASCNGAADGSLTAIAGDGTPGYTYAWSSGANAATANGLGAGTYTVTVTDANGCTALTTGTVNEPTPVTASISASSDALCNGSSDGSATATGNGGTPGYSYQWSNGSLIDIAGGLATGTYTVTVTDANGCTATSTATISEPAPLVLNVTGIDATCGNPDGSASVVVNGGTPGYTYAWNPTGGNGTNASGLSAGLYTVVVNDANGCTATGNTTIGDTPGPTVTLNTTTDVSCPGGSDGSIDVSVSAGSAPYSYSWSSGGSVNPATGLAAGSYTVTVTDDNGCTSTLVAAVNEPPVITLTPATTTAHCGLADGSGDFTPAGGTPGYSFLWSDGSVNQLIQNVTAGTYTVTVTDANGCTESASLVIADDPPPVIAVSATTDASCNGGADGTITVTVNGGVAPYNIAWSSGAVGTTATGLAAGTYTATVTDASGCTATISGSVAEPTIIQLQLSATSATCGTANGSATVVANGGTPGYTYNWIPSGGNAAVANNLTSGGYTVEVTDANGCTMQDVIAVPSANGPSASVLLSTDVSCNGGADGSLTIDVSGGTAPLTYVWSAGGTGTSGSGLTAGTYTVTVTDDNGCSSTVTAIINEPLLLTVSGTPYTSHCGQADGSADVVAADGTAPYSYAWSTGSSSTANLTGVTTGSYTATVTDANGCTAEVTLNVPDAPGPVVSLNATTDVTCNGGADGSIDVGVAGGAAPYTYNWSNGGNTSTNSGLAAGTYTVTVTDNFGCTAVLSATVNEPTALQLSFVTTDATCGSANGTATVTATDGTPGYTYLWDSGDVTAAASALTPGNYSVTVTDANGCTIQGSTTVSSANSPVASVLLSTDVSCNGGADGSLTIDVTGGTAPLNYVWSAGGSGTSGSNLTAGNYTVTVTDANGCSSFVTATINEPLLLTLSGSANTAHCGQADGSATVVAADGTAPYSYSWSTGGSSSANLLSIAAGSYTATVTDANGCTATTTIAVPDATGPTVTLTTAADVSCNGGADGSIDVSVNGGTAPYAYVWSNGWLAAQNNNLSTGNYTVTVTDVFGCTSTLSTTINEPAALQLSFSHTDATCGGSNGSATVNVNGGTAPLNYLWVNGDVNASALNLAAGNYSVTVTDANGCTATGSTALNDLAAPVLSPGVITGPACNGAAGGSAEVLISSGNGPYTYSWSPSGGSAAQASGLTAGTYTVTVTDINGCTTDLSLVVNEPTALVVNNLTTPVYCFGGADGTATIDAQGGTSPYTFDWNPGGIQSAARINLSAGTYTVTVTDANGCTAVTQAVVTEPTDLSTVMSSTAASCNGGNDGQASALAAGGTGPYTYLWSSGGVNAAENALLAGTYTITITDNNGCTHQDQVVVSEPAAIVLNTSSTDATCGSTNGTAQVNSAGGTGAITYLWSDGTVGANISGLAAGAYTVTATDANGCTAVTNATVSNLGGPTAVVQSVSDATCFAAANGSATVNVSSGNGPFTYSWSPSGGNAASASGLAAGNYAVDITDVNGCTSTLAVVVQEPTAILPVTYSAQETCNASNGTAGVNVNGGTTPYTYQWSNGGVNDNITGVGAGTYTVTITDGNGCTSVIAANVTATTPPTASAVTTDVNCNGGTTGTATVTANDGSLPYFYQWSSGGVLATENNLGAGTYTCIITDGDGCTYAQQVTIQEPGAINIQITPADATCGQSNGSLSALANGGTGALSYAWSTGQAVANISGLSAGTYTVTVTDANGCTSTLPGAVANMGGPVAALQAQTNVSCNGGADGSASVNVSSGNGPFTYQWTPSGGSSNSASGLTAGPYVVNITDNNGCQSSVNVTITEPVAINLSVSSSQASCGNANGSATVLANGGTGAYQYLWSNGAVTASAPSLSAGTYSVTVTDANGCSNNVSIAVTQPSSLNVTPASTDVTCYNGNDGTASVSVSGGSAPYNYLWSNGNVTNAVNNLSAGNYTATVTDGTGCSFASTFTIQQAAQISVQLTPTDASCGQSNGSLSALANGGTGALSYLWSNGQNTTNISGLAAGTYTVTVTDANGCTEVTPAAVGNLGGPVAALQAQTDVTCNGGADGSATINVSAGNGPFTYQWNPAGGSNASASGLTAGPYVVNITDNNGCQSVVNVQINEPTALNLAVNSTAASCGNANGSAGVVVNGGTGAYQYLWSNGVLTANNAAVPAGNYTVTVTDANGCTATSSVAVTQPSSLSVTPATTNVSCNGGNDGTASVTVNGGSAPYTYLWNNGEVAASVNNLTAGTYTATITDGTGCSYQQQFIITEPTAIQLQFTITDASCGGSNGSAQVNVFGGSGGLTWSWSGGQSSQNITNVPAGTYTVTATDGSGCTVSGVASIANQGGPQLSAAASTDVSCNGGNDGSATVAVTSGNGPFTYAWSAGGSTGVTAGSLSPGNYTVTVTDANGCISQQTFTINDPPALLVTLNGQQATCGQANGNITAVASGGTGAFTYTWSNGAPNAAQASQLAAGTYSVTVTDIKGCTVSSSLSISNAAGPVVAVNNVTGVSCAGAGDGSAGVSVISGSGPFTYSWTPSGGTAASASGLSGGNYTVLITDPNGCTAQQGIIIQEPNAVILQITTTPANCNAANGTAYVQALGGTPSYSYLWNNGQLTATATALYTGNYTVTITDAHGCTAVAQTNVSGLPGPAINAVTTNDVACYGGTSGGAQVSCSNGSAPYDYLWSSGDTTATVNGLAAGSYTVTVTDFYGCADQKGFSILQPAPLSLQAAPVTMVNCNGGNDGSAEALVSGGISPYTFQWSNGDLNSLATQLSAGSYSVTITDANGCSTVAVTQITEPTSLLVSNTQTTNASCYGLSDGSATFASSGGTAPYQYLWSNGATTAAANGLAAGNYVVTVTDQHGCTELATVSITQPTQIVVSPLSVTAVKCYGGNDGTVTMNAVGGSSPYTYQWSTGTSGITAGNLQAGSYTVTVTDDNGCVQLASVTVAQPALLQLQSVVSPILCFGQSNAAINISPNGGVTPYSYTWSTGAVTPAITSLPAGNYSITVTDANNCKTDTSFVITQPTMLVAAVVNPDTICIGQSTSLNVNVSGGTPAYTYLWNNGQTSSPLSVNPAVSSVYSVVVTDAHGCTKTVTNINVTVFPALNISVAVDKDTICEGETVHLTSSGGGGNGGPYTYIWNPVQGSVTSFNAQPDTTTLYQVSISDGCTVIEPMAVTQVLVHPLPEIVFDPIDTAGCMPFEVPFNFTGITTANATYQWNFGDNLTAAGVNPTHIFMKDGTYDVTLTVIDQYGCTDTRTETAAVTVYPLPVAFYNTQPQYLSILHPEVQFLNESEGASISHWNFVTNGYTTDEWNPVYTFADTGRYWIQLVVISNEGCVDTFLNEVVLHDEVSFYVPNAFSPNNDGKNDDFTGYGIGIERAEFFIFDRWGKMIYKADALSKPWDGTYWNSGEPCPEGTYVYLFQVHHGDPVPTEYKGRVSLVR